MSFIICALIIAVIIILLAYNRPEQFASGKAKDTELKAWFTANPDADYKKFRKSFDRVNVIDYEKYKYGTL